MAFLRYFVLAIGLAGLIPHALAEGEPEAPRETVREAPRDALRLALEASRASGKGVNLYLNGQAIAGVVVSVDDLYVVARSQALGQIVIRLDRLDGVAGFVGGPGSAGRKSGNE